MWCKTISCCIITLFICGCSALYDEANIVTKSELGKINNITYIDAPVVRQKNRWDCGYASLASALQYLYPDIKGIDTVVASDKKGATLGQLKAIAEKYQAKAFILSLDGDELRQQIRHGRPILVPVDYGINFIVAKEVIDHFVLLIGITDERVIVMNPASGYQTMSIDDLHERRQEYHYAALLISK